MQEIREILKAQNNNNNYLTGRELGILGTNMSGKESGKSLEGRCIEGKRVNAEKVVSA